MISIFPEYLLCQTAIPHKLFTIEPRMPHHTAPLDLPHRGSLLRGTTMDIHFSPIPGSGTLQTYGFQGFFGILCGGVMFGRWYHWRPD